MALLKDRLDHLNESSSDSWLSLLGKFGKETAAFFGKLVPRLIPAVAAGIYGPLAAKRWKEGDVEGAILAAAQVAGGVSAIIPLIGIPTSWTITAMVLTWEMMRNTPDGKSVLDKIKQIDGSQTGDETKKGDRKTPGTAPQATGGTGSNLAPASDSTTAPPTKRTANDPLKDF